MINDHKVEQRISMDIPGRVDSKHDMVSGFFSFEDGEALQFKALYSEIDGMQEIIIQVPVDVGVEKALVIQKFVAEKLFNKEDFEEEVKREVYVSLLQTPGKEYSGYDVN